MPRFVNFMDFRGQPIVVNADLVIYVRAFGSLTKTEIAFSVAQQNPAQNQALCVVVEGSVESVTRELDGGFAAGRPSASATDRRSNRLSADEHERLMAARG